MVRDLCKTLLVLFSQTNSINISSQSITRPHRYWASPGNTYYLAIFGGEVITLSIRPYFFDSSAVIQ